MPDELDAYEKHILRELQRDANQTTAQIAEKVGLSSSPCWRRIERLEREGFIKARVAIVDRRKIGLNAHIFAQVKLNAHGRAHLDEFSAAIREFPEVLWTCPRKVESFPEMKGELDDEAATVYEGV